MRSKAGSSRLALNLGSVFGQKASLWFLQWMAVGTLGCKGRAETREGELGEGLGLGSFREKLEEEFG